LIIAPLGARLPYSTATPPSALNGSDLEVLQVTEPFGEEERITLDVLQVLAERLAGDGETAEVQHFPELEHDRGNTSRVPEVLDRVAAGRLDVGEHGDPPVDAVEVVDGDLDARLPRDRREVQERVRRPADRGVQDDRVLERLAGQDAPRRQLVVDEVDELFAGRAGVP
jgi:hypothetical protein